MPEVLGRLLDCRGDLLGVHHVGGQDEGVAAHLGDRGGGAFRAFRVDVEHRDVGAELGQTEGDALPDPASGPGHDGGLTGEQDVGRVERGVERIAGDFERLRLVQIHERSSKASPTGVNQPGYMPVG